MTKLDLIEATDFLNTWLNVVIDRPLGSAHPSGRPIYPINYGYVPNTVVGDGLEQDAYILGVNEACNEYYGYCTAVIKRHNDVEDKLVLVPSENFATTLTDDMILQQTAFIEQYFDISVIRRI